ncbi:hypothetical protein GDO78_017083 [Eleutherodactylus coqui]|uniref:Uncharacterized protein n=1 Tax=Eleutherodactylus coqui TaxID=57060 RepID=A0A8J6BN41_ELECQ|nr:hypothetical protein GDO78_017083 [Eleutherodactylus coqui]
MRCGAWGCQRGLLYHGAKSTQSSASHQGFTMELHSSRVDGAVLAMERFLSQDLQSCIHSSPGCCLSSVSILPLYSTHTQTPDVSSPPALAQHVEDCRRRGAVR